MNETVRNMLPQSLLWQVLFGVGVIALIHGAITLAAKWWIYTKVKEMHEINQSTSAEFWAGFDTLKSWVMSARAASKDAEYAVKHTLTTDTSKSQTLHKVQNLSDASAEEVGNKMIKEAQDDIASYQKPPSGKNTEL